MARNYAYGHSHFSEDCGVQSGIETGNRAEANAYTDKAVTFPKTFAEAPVVVVSFATDSTAAAMGGLSVSAINRTTTGFTIRFFNNTNTARVPPVSWIATGKMA